MTMTATTTPTHPWLIYFKERCPLGSYVLLSVGIGLGPQVLSGASVSLGSALWSALLMFCFFVVLRMMDEVKDYKKDQIAHPDRPLPRGLISYDAAKRAVQIGLAVMGVFCALTFALWGLTPAVLYGVTILYLYLMYREFYCGPQLERYPLVYAGSHQAILFLLCATAAACAGTPAGPGSWTQWKMPEAGLLMAGLQIFPAFFAYEIGRKMNPDAHPNLGYYRQTYGLFGCRLILSGLLLLGALGLYWGVITTSFISEAGLYSWFGLGTLGIALSFVATWFAGDRGYKWIGHATTINLMLAVYAPILAFYGFS